MKVPHACGGTRAVIGKVGGLQIPRSPQREAQMPEGSTQVRTIEPFGFWPQYASAIGGLGGDQGGPDPYYCFHTPYLEYQPGGLVFRLRLIGAKATEGELALRVHAWKADGSIDAVLVGGMRVELDGLDGDYEYAVRVASLPGVIYAFFGRYSQPSDLTIDDLLLTAEELADEDVNTYASVDLSPTAFGAKDYSAPSHLTLITEPTLRAPLSQAYSDAQLTDAALHSVLPDAILALDDNHARWREAYAWQVLSAYRMAEPGASGYLRVADGSPLRGLLEQRGALVTDTLAQGMVGCHDFLVDMSPFEGGGGTTNPSKIVLEKLTALRKGGLGIFVFTAQIGGLASVSASVRDEAGWIAREQDIQQLALKVIGHGSDIAQIVWPRDRDLSPIGPFGLLVRR